MMFFTSVKNINPSEFYELKKSNNNFRNLLLDLTLKYETVKIKNLNKKDRRFVYLQMYNGLIFKKENNNIIINNTNYKKKTFNIKKYFSFNINTFLTIINILNIIYLQYLYYYKNINYYNNIKL